MLFRLKYTRVTYQRLVNTVFYTLVKKTMEAYVNDMPTKSLKGKDHVFELKKTFDIFKKYNTKLNSANCSSSVSSSKLLGFIVTK